MVNYYMSLIHDLEKNCDLNSEFERYNFIFKLRTSLTLFKQKFVGGFISNYKSTPFGAKFTRELCHSL